MVWKLWREQKLKVKSWLFQKSWADNFRTQTAIEILRPRCTQLHIMEIHCGKFEKNPMEYVGGVAHTRNC